MATPTGLMLFINNIIVYKVRDGASNINCTMGTLSSWTTAKNLLNSIQLCDIVEFNRITYSHFGFYIGNGLCVHVQAPNESSFGSFSRSSSSESSASDSGTKVVELLTNIAGVDGVRINNVEFMAFQLGVKRRPTVEAIQLATSGLPVDCNNEVIPRKSINVTYFLVSNNNCEGWSTYWRYDHRCGWSIQAANGVIHSTIGTVERFSDTILFEAESILTSDSAPAYKKATAAAVVVPYAAAKYSAICVKNVADVAVGSLMRMFR